MNYNIHPLFVHFPIALLFVYSIIKILPVQKFLPKIGWKDIERILLFVGVLGAFAASITGEMAEELTRPSHQLVEAHSTFAGLTTILYGILLLGEILAYFSPKFLPKISSIKIADAVRWVESVLQNPIFSGVVALVALVTLTITGVLGGVLVYGVTADPLAPLLLNILNITI